MTNGGLQERTQRTSNNNSSNNNSGFDANGERGAVSGERRPSTQNGGDLMMLLPKKKASSNSRIGFPYDGGSATHTTATANGGQQRTATRTSRTSRTHGRQEGRQASAWPATNVKFGSTVEAWLQRGALTRRRRTQRH